MSKLIDDVNELLFTQIENLNKDMIPSKLEQEVIRTRSMISASGEIGRNLKIKLDAMKVASQGPYSLTDIPEDFCIQKNNKP